MVGRQSTIQLTFTASRLIDRFVTPAAASSALAFAGS